MVQYLQFRILEFPLIYVCVSINIDYLQIIIVHNSVYIYIRFEYFDDFDVYITGCLSNIMLYMYTYVSFNQSLICLKHKYIHIYI